MDSHRVLPFRRLNRHLNVVNTHTNHLVSVAEGNPATGGFQYSRHILPQTTACLVGHMNPSRAHTIPWMDRYATFGCMGERSRSTAS